MTICLSVCLCGWNRWSFWRSIYRKSGLKKKGLGAPNSVFDYCIIMYNPMRSFENQNKVNRPRFEVTVTVSGRVPSAPKVRWLELVKGLCSPKTVHGMHNRGKKRCFGLLIQKLQFIANALMQGSGKSEKIRPS